MTRSANTTNGAIVGTPSVPAIIPTAGTNAPSAPTAPSEIGEGGVLKSIPLTAEQAASWEATMTHMLWVAPGFRHLFFKLLAHNHNMGEAEHVAVFTKAIPRAATDNCNILLNPDWFFRVPIPQRTFALCHEVMHNVYQDVPWLKACNETHTVPMTDGTMLPFSENVFQRALDFRINPLLVDSKMGKPPEDICYDKHISEHGMESFVDIYKKIYEDEGHGKGKGLIFDLVLPGGKSAGAAGQGKAPNSARWKIEVAVARRLEEQRSRGKLPGGLKHMFDEILTPVVAWQDHLRAVVQRVSGTGGRDWRRPDRRMMAVHDIYYPSRTGFGAGWVVVWGDTSGSVSDAELNSFMPELSAILEDTRPKRLTVIWCDAKIQHVDELESVSDLEAAKRRGVGGRGGTSVAPVFNWIAENNYGKPDMFVAFTDCEVTFPPEPDYPTIWASVSKAGAPYGETIYINPQRE